MYFVTLAVFFLIDMIWLGIVAKGFYRKHLGSMLNPKVNWPAAFLFYLVFIIGLLVFVIKPALLNGRPLEALLFGGLFGLISYATYDLTNMATIDNWPLKIVVVDIIWGSLLCLAVSASSYLIAQLLI